MISARCKNVQQATSVCIRQRRFLSSPSDFFSSLHVRWGKKILFVTTGCLCRFHSQSTAKSRA